MGSIYGIDNIVAFINQYIREAYTRAKFTGSVYNCKSSPLGLQTRCEYSVQNWCTAATTPPTFNLNGVLLKTFKA